MSSILTNNSAMVALQTLKSVNNNLQSTQNEISTGKSVSSAKDNSAIWAISKVMESDVKGFKGISESLSLGSSSISVARNAAESITDLLTEVKGKIVAAQEENVDRDKIQTDIVALRDQISSITNAAQFNGLNFVDGTDDVKILSSLDRQQDGTVQAREITVARQDLTQKAAALGTGDDITGTATVSGGGNNAGTANSVDFTTVAVTSATEGAQTFEVDGFEMTITTADGDSATDVRDAMLAALTTAQTDGDISADIAFAANGADKVAITNNQGFAAVDLGDAGDSITADAATVEARAETVTLSDATRELAENDAFELTIGEQKVTYVATASDTYEDVLDGLSTQIGNLEGDFSGQVTGTAGNPTLSVVNDTGSSVAFSLATKEDGIQGGGLNALASINVSTDSGAEASLNSIEKMIQTSIDAAASFGSAEGRLETQSDFVSQLTDTLKSGIGAMVDADMEETSARLQALQVQQQLATQSLSIANQAPQSILSLFR